MNNRFDNTIVSMMETAGWHNQRSVMLPSLPEDYPIFDAAINVLKEFGGLHIGSVGPGVECATSDINYDPAAASGLSRHTGLTAPNNLKIFPLGEIHNAHAYLFIDERGGIYIYFDRLEFYAASHDKAVRRLLRGEAKD